MAKDTADNVTGNLFNQTESEDLIAALHTQVKTLQRKVNTEKNQLIRKIHQDELQRVVNLTNKIQGL